MVNIKNFTRLFFFFVLYFQVTSVIAQPVVIEKTKLYMIQGQDDYDLRSQIETKGPIKHYGRRLTSSTDWQVKWNYQTQILQNGRCHLKGIKTKLFLTHHHPEWTNQTAGPDNLRADWQTYQTAIKEHQKGHKKIGLQAAQQISNRLVSLGSESDCAKLTRRASTVSEALINQYQNMDRTYDERTEYGREQGAYFP